MRGKASTPAREVKDAPLVQNEDTLTRWKEYYEQLMNGENEGRTMSAPEIGGEVNRMSTEEVKKVITKMKKGEAVEPQTLIYKLAYTRKRRALDITDNIYVNDSNGNDAYRGITQDC